MLPIRGKVCLMHAKRNRILSLAMWSALLSSGILVSDTRASQEEVHPALARYPSPGELQMQVEALRATGPDALCAASRDLDLVIRSHFTLGEQVPQVPGRKQRTPHVPPRWPRVTGLTTREALNGYIERLQSTPGAEARIQFYRDHMEDYCIDDCPGLRMALADVLLNGWHDWSEWHGEKLIEVREALPDLHRAYALQLARRFEITQYNGLALRMLVDPSTPKYVRRYAASLVSYPDNNLDVLDFIVTQMLATKDEVVREFLLSCISNTGIPPHGRRAFWEEYLSTADITLRSVAVIEVGHAVRHIRSKTKGTDLSPEIIAKLKEIAENDSDERIRESAGRAVRRMESSPFRGYSPRPREQGNSEERQWPDGAVSESPCVQNRLL